MKFTRHPYKGLSRTGPRGTHKSSVLAIVALAVLSLLLCSSLVSAATAGGESPSYTIYIDGSTIKAVNGATGAVDYSGSSGATVIQSAINALTNGGKVFIKAGTYSISTTITPTTSTIHKLSSADWLVKSPSYTIYIDGSTIKAVNGATGAVDYSGSSGATVIQSAINALTNGGKVFIKAGTYSISTTITPTTSTIHNIELCGEGNATILRLANSVNSQVFSLLHLNNWYIHDLQIDGNRANQDQGQYAQWTGPSAHTSQACDGIRFSYGTNILIEDCYIHDCRCFGVNAYGAMNVQVHRCYMVNNDANHINFATCNDSMATENVVDGSSDIAITTLAGNNTIFARNTVRNCNLNRSPFCSNSHKGLCAEAAERPVDSTLFEDNYIDNCDMGIVSDPNLSTTRLVIRGNRIYSCYDGISLMGITTDCLVEGNSIYSSRRDGIHVAAPTVSELQVIGNYVSDSNRNGIYSHSDRALIVGNNVHSSSGAGIYTNKHTQVLVAFNTIDTTGYGNIFAKDGVAMDDGCSFCLIVGNQIASSAQDGVRLSGSVGNGALNNLIAWNTITSAGNNGVSLFGSASTGNEIIGNSISNFRNTPIYDGGTNTVITDNKVLVSTTSSTTSSVLTTQLSTTTTTATSRSMTSQRTTSSTTISTTTSPVTTSSVTTRITTSTRHPSPVTTKIITSTSASNDIHYEDLGSIWNHNLI